MNSKKCRSVYILSLFLLGFPLHAETPDQEKFDVGQAYSEAIVLYVDETLEFIATLDETIDEEKTYRYKVLQEQFDKKIQSVEITLSKSNKEAILEIEKHIKSSGVDSLDDSLLMRLSQLYYERENFDFGEKMRVYEKDLAAYSAGLKKSLPDLPMIDYSKTIFYAQKLIDRFEVSPLLDKALYLLGYCLFDKNEGDRAAKLYEQLLRSTPNSPLADEVRWRLAEHFFDTEQFVKAQAYYKRLAQSSSTFKNKATYKWGASFYAQSNYSQAAEIFLKLYRDTRQANVVDRGENQTLGDESLDYLAHIRSKRTPLALTEEEDADVTEALAKAYKRAQDDSNVRQTYLDFVKRSSLSIYSPRFMDRVIGSYDEIDEAEKAEAIRGKLLAGLEKNSVWWTKHKNNVSATVEAEDIFEFNLLRSARYLALRATDEKSPALFMRATSTYRNFLTNYGFSPLAYQARYELAELNYAFGKYSEASKGYEEVVVDAQSVEFREEAAYGLVLSESKRVGLGLLEQASLRPQRSPNGGLLPPTPPTESERAFLRAAQTYVNVVPDGTRRQKIVYKAAEILFQHNQFEKVRTVLESTIDETQPNALTLKSLRLIGETYDLEKNWEKVAETNRRAMSMGSVSSDSEALGNTVRPGNNALNLAIKLDKANESEKSAQEYEQFALAFPRSPDAPFALWRAAELYRRVGLINESNRNADRLISGYPSNDLAVRAQFLLAQNDESIAEFERAAGRYEDFAKRNPKHALTVEAYRSAAVLRHFMKNEKQAAQNYEAFSKLQPSADTYFELAEYYSRAGQLDKATSAYVRFTSGANGADYQVRGLFKMAKLKPELAARNCKQIAEIASKNKGRMSALASHDASGCTYLETLSARNELLDMKFEQANLENQLKRFDEKNRKLMLRYSEIVKTSDREWIASALVDAADIHLSSMAKLGNLKGDLVSLRIEQAQKKAIDFYRKALDQANGNLSLDAAQRAIQAMKSRGAPGLLMTRPEILWPSDQLDARLIAYEYPPEAVQKETEKWAELRSAFEGGDWTTASEVAVEMYNKNKNSYWASMAAHSLTNLGQHGKAKAILADALDKAPDKLVASAYLNFATEDASAEKAFKVLASVESEKAAVLASYARGLKSKGDKRSALNWARKSIKKNTRYAPSYGILAQLFADTGFPELAQSTMDSGLRNATQDSALSVQKGYFLLNQKLPDRALSVADSTIDSDPSWDTAYGLKSFAHISRNEPALATSTMKSAMEKLTNKSEALPDSFAVALLTKDQAWMEQLLPEMERRASENSRTSYLMGIYYHSLKNDGNKAKKYFQQARDLGLNNIWMQIALSDIDQSRLPSGEDEKQELK